MTKRKIDAPRAWGIEETLYGLRAEARFDRRKILSFGGTAVPVNIIRATDLRYLQRVLRAAVALISRSDVVNSPMHTRGREYITWVPSTLIGELRTALAPPKRKGRKG